jgi:hypothetical protein
MLLRTIVLGHTVTVPKIVLSEITDSEVIDASGSLVIEP